MPDTSENPAPGPGLVYIAGVFIFITSAMGFFNRLFWIMLIVQRSIVPEAVPQSIADQIELLNQMEQQIPQFHLRLLYGLLLSIALVVTASGILKFRERARRAMQFLLGLDALVFLGLIIHYKAVGFIPKMVEQFHLKFFIVSSRVLLLMFLDSSIFLRAFSVGQKHRQEQRENPNDGKGPL